jgi:hypothetical protein
VSRGNREADAFSFAGGLHRPFWMERAFHAVVREIYSMNGRNATFFTLGKDVLLSAVQGMGSAVERRNSKKVACAA